MPNQCQGQTKKGREKTESKEIKTRKETEKNKKLKYEEMDKRSMQNVPGSTIGTAKKMSSNALISTTLAIFLCQAF